MTEPAPTKDRAIGYAEDVLKVHEVYEESRSALADLAEAQAAAVEHAAQKRIVQEAIAQREAIVTGDERAKHADTSATAFEKILKGILQTDDELVRLRGEQMEALHQHDLAEAAVRMNEQRIRIATARMGELDGLLNFYAATKTARQRRDEAT